VGRALFGYGVDVPSPFNPAQNRFLTVTIVVLGLLVTAAAFLVGLLADSYLRGFATALGGSAVEAVALLLLTRRWRDRKPASEVS
jgi:membrane protein implicated in regulation of membrane protease activity